MAPRRGAAAASAALLAAALSLPSAASNAIVPPDAAPAAPLRVSEAAAALNVDAFGAVGAEAKRRPRGGKRAGGGAAGVAAAARGGASGASTATGPIVAPRSYMQLHPAIEARSMALGAWRHAVLITDGAVHRTSRDQEEPSFFGRLFGRRAAPTWPFSYVIGADGSLIYRCRHDGRTALPYGVAESAADGRVAFTFYQAPRDSIEVWSSDLQMKLTFHDTSIKPAVPAFVGNEGNLWVPYTVADRLDEETEKVITLYIYDKDGGRVEVFPRREWHRVHMPHTIAVDGDGRLYAAGLYKWAWEDSAYGDVELKAPRPENAEAGVAGGVYTRLEVYEIEDNVRSPEVRREVLARARERKPELPEDARFSPAEIDELGARVKGALAVLGSWPFPGAPCAWPLFALTGDGAALTACYDSDMLYVVRVWDASGARDDAGARELAPNGPLEVLARVRAPAGIARIGAIAMDPSGRSFALLDRGRGRVYGVEWPFDAEDLAARREEEHVVVNFDSITWTD